jgi:hypothetical protein
MHLHHLSSFWGEVQRAHEDLSWRNRTQKYFQGDSTTAGADLRDGARRNEPRYRRVSYGVDVGRAEPFFGREPDERKEGETNHRNGSYERWFTMKRIGEVVVEVPGDRNGEIRSEVFP